jgi:hypothetical protein
MNTLRELIDYTPELERLREEASARALAIQAGRESSAGYPVRTIVGWHKDQWGNKCRTVGVLL